MGLPAPAHSDFRSAEQDKGLEADKVQGVDMGLEADMGRGVDMGSGQTPSPS